MNRAEFNAVIRQTGIPATVTQATPNGLSVNLPFVAVARVGNESTLVNEYGVGARILTFRQSDVPFALVKFDVVEIDSERLVLDFVHPIHETGSGQVMGWRGVSRGK